MQDRTLKVNYSKRTSTIVFPDLKVAIEPFVLGDRPGFAYVGSSGFRDHKTAIFVCQPPIDGHYSITKVEGLYEKPIAIRHSRKAALNYCFDSALRRILEIKLCED